MNILHLILGLLGGIAWGTGCWFLIRKNKTKPQKTGMYIATVLVFILCAGLHAGIQIGVPIAQGAIQGNMPTVDEYLKNDLVQVLLSIMGSSDLPQSASELEVQLLATMGRIVFWVYMVIAFILALHLFIRIIQAVKKPEAQETPDQETQGQETENGE